LPLAPLVDRTTVSAAVLAGSTLQKLPFICCFVLFKFDCVSFIHHPTSPNSPILTSTHQNINSFVEFAFSLPKTFTSPILPPPAAISDLARGTDVCGSDRLDHFGKESAKDTSFFETAVFLPLAPLVV
jgi:hypothetical protein